MCSVCNRESFSVFAFYLKDEAFAQELPFLKNVLKLSFVYSTYYKCFYYCFYIYIYIMDLILFMYDYSIHVIMFTLKLKKPLKVI